MLVCVSFAQFCTRDRGCSAHPAFSAPSCFEGQPRKARAHRTARMRTHIRCLKFESGPTVVPALSRDPYAAAVMMGGAGRRPSLNTSPRSTWVPAQGRDDEWRGMRGAMTLMQWRGMSFGRINSCAGSARLLHSEASADPIGAAGDGSSSVFVESRFARNPAQYTRGTKRCVDFRGRL